MVPWHLQPRYAAGHGRDQLEKHSGVDRSKSSQERGASSVELADRPGSTWHESGHCASGDVKDYRSDCSILRASVTHEENLIRLGYHTFLRYYHVFRKGELGDLVRSATPNASIVEEYYDHENWCVLAEKT